MTGPYIQEHNNKITTIQTHIKINNVKLEH